MGEGGGGVKEVSMAGWGECKKKSADYAVLKKVSTSIFQNLEGLSGLPGSAGLLLMSFARLRIKQTCVRCSLSCCTRMQLKKPKITRLISNSSSALII